MNPLNKNILWLQFGASIDALENALVACPDELWGQPWGGLKEWAGYWHLVYHTLFWLDLYLYGSRDGFAQPAPFNHASFDPAKQVYSKAELQTYLRYCRQKCQSVLEALDEKNAQRICHFPWTGDISFIELQLYNMRHVQHHAAQLNLLLRQTIDDSPDWVVRAKRVE